MYKVPDRLTVFFSLPFSTPTHRFAMGNTMAAYGTFADAGNTGALKVVLSGSKQADAVSEDFAEAALA